MIPVHVAAMGGDFLFEIRPNQLTMRQLSERKRNRTFMQRLYLAFVFLAVTGLGFGVLVAIDKAIGS
jgi:hypothetical protein